VEPPVKIMNCTIDFQLARHVKVVGTKITYLISDTARHKTAKSAVNMATLPKYAGPTHGSYLGE